eukprot:TRINITY_DN4590_c0_g1_i1.p1 TRINITY_DN4590_c0_g1~~TRINITY_DN4590_c0_g1_i1.p1  ORF type:complete len:233 (-),score=22.41 TRINITY_DN4590_c0_g1_i1:93-725(-)
MVSSITMGIYAKMICENCRSGFWSHRGIDLLCPSCSRAEQSRTDPAPEPHAAIRSRSTRSQRVPPGVAAAPRNRSVPTSAASESEQSSLVQISTPSQGGGVFEGVGVVDSQPTRIGGWRRTRSGWRQGPETADPMSVARLPTASTGDWIGEDCAVCLSELSVECNACVLPRCGHVFHRSCIEAWLVRGRAVCPLDKSSVFECCSSRELSP